jgi:hypothetical protein
MVDTGKVRHRGAALGREHVGRAASPTGDRLQVAHRLVKRATALLNPGVKAGHGVIAAIDLAS